MYEHKKLNMQLLKHFFFLNKQVLCVPQSDLAEAHKCFADFNFRGGVRSVDVG